MSFKTYNGAMPTTAALPAVATGTAIKTMLQIASPASRMLRVVSWGFTMDALVTGVIELIQTDVAATVTAHTSTGIVNDDPNGTASLVTLGASATGYTATVEGATTATRLLDIWTPGASASATYTYQFLPNETKIVAISKFLRVRTTMGTTTNLRTWVSWEEI